MGNVRIGIIGTGWGATVQAPGFRCVAGAEVVAITSGRRERAEAVAREFGIPHAFDDYREMLRSVELDLVSIVTPPYLHCEMAVAALEAGAHVLCEKPMAMDVREAGVMIAAAQSAGKIAAIDHEWRFVPARLAMKRLIAAGEIGDPFLVCISDLFLGRIGEPYHWWYDRARGGGIFGAMASHYVDAIHQWIGSFERVSADLRAVVEERALPDGSSLERVTADDTVLLAFRLESGATGRIDVSCAAPGGMRRMEVFGPGGGLLIESGKLYRPTQGKLEEIQPEAFELGRLEDARLGPFVELGQRLIDCINGGDSGPIPTFPDGFEVQRVLDAARRSSDERREVRIAEMD